MSAPEPVEHFFRHEYGRLVAMLVRRVGTQHLEAVEDAVQTALMAGLENWTVSGPPDNPPAWLFQVARNHLMGELRRQEGRRRVLERRGGDPVNGTEDGPNTFLAGQVSDDLLQMLFVCCDETIPVESQLVLALKTLCGFEVREIAPRLFTSEANVYKRLNRARRRLRASPDPIDDPGPERYADRLAAVRNVLYLMFTEGHLSARKEMAIREELCAEAIRLASVLAEHPIGRTPETCALLALMHLHAARLTSRQDAGGDLLLLEEQDRSLWDQERIQTGLVWLAKSAQGDVFSRYHAEAGIAAEHCLAPSFAETRWDRIAECYALLERLAPSPMHTLNRAVAVAEYQGPGAGLAVLDALRPPGWLAGSCLWSAVQADLHRRCGNARMGERYRREAFESAPTPAVKILLKRRLGNPD